MVFDVVLREARTPTDQDRLVDIGLPNERISVVEETFRLQIDGVELEADAETGSIGRAVANVGLDLRHLQRIAVRTLHGRDEDVESHRDSYGLGSGKITIR